MGWCFVGSLCLFIPGVYFGVQFAKNQLKEQLVESFYRLADSEMTKEKAKEYVNMAVIEVQKEIQLRGFVSWMIWKPRKPDVK